MEPILERPPRIPESLWASLSPEFKMVLFELCEENRLLRDEVRDLKARLNQNSSNSSFPPSSDRPWAKPQHKKKARGGKRGGQKGHRPHLRELLPPESVRSVEECVPSECRFCSHGELLEDESVAVRRHQIVDLPDIVPDVVEYRLHARRCARCHKTTRARLPAGVPTGNLGPRVQALVAVLTARFRLSKREVRQVVHLVTRVVISLGTVADIEQTVSHALERPVAEIQEALKQSAVVHHDETGWREANQKAWLWTTVTENYAVYKIDLKRSGAVARQLLGGADFAGHVVTDRYKAYSCYPMERRSICHAHLDRDYKKIADRVGPGKAIGIALCTEEDKVFAAWHDFKDGKIDRPQLQTRIDQLATQIGRLLNDGAECGDSKVEGMCRDILAHWQAIWAFAFVEGVEPTNNTAEQAVRPFVLWRKGSFGTQSARGSRFVERMATIAETCRRQGRQLLDFVTHALRSWHAGVAPPSLILTPPDG